LTAWLVAHTIGPANTMPVMMIGHWPSAATPEEIAPQANAHMGGNQVMGFSNSATAEKEGRLMQPIVPVTVLSVN
jgi:hypothetical protein